MSDILNDLTPAQCEAVTHMDGPMLVLAGAGSGKTRVVTRRIAHLIARGVRPQHILAMTFTNKAASEMKERVASLVGDAPRWVGTFHSACARLLRQDLAKMREGRDGDFTIYDDSEQQTLVKNCIKDLGLDKSEDRRLTPGAVHSRIGHAKCRMIAPEDFGRGTYEDELVARIYAAYEKQLREMNAVDFDDLLILAVRLLTQQPHLRDVYHSRFRYLLIDEYQDTNRIQYELLRLLTGPARNVHVTGDPDQSIYSWRGAEYRNIMDFSTDFEGARVVRLEQNYRSTKLILAAANGLIRNNTYRMEKDLFTENDEGVPVQVLGLRDDRDEATWVAERAATLRREGHRLGEMAVFYRTNAQSRPFEEALMGAAIPYQIIGGVRFYERKEIKDLLAHLKMLVNPRDVISLQRILGCRPAGLGPKTLAKLVEACNEHREAVFHFLCREDFEQRARGKLPAKTAPFAHWCRTLSTFPLTPVSDCVHRVLEHSGLAAHYDSHREADPHADERIENLNAFVARAVEFEMKHPGADLRAFLEDVALVADVDGWDGSRDCLSLMTLHSSKGLEFPFVFIVGVEKGLLPHQNSRTPRALEEERRLLYVGITRAQRAVTLTHATCRFRWGEHGDCTPSPFLEELPEDAVERIELAF